MSYSRFFLSDLHVHTPADFSHNYGDVGGPKPNADFADKLVRAHVEAGVEVIAVTDHNSVDWYPMLREAGDAHGLAVFPGVEVSIQRCHLTVLWERSDEGYELASQFLAQLWQPQQERFRDNGQPIPVSRGQVLDVAKIANDYAGVVLAPHVTSRQNGFSLPAYATTARTLRGADS